MNSISLHRLRLTVQSVSPGGKCIGRLHHTFDQKALFTMARELYRAWVTNLPLPPAGVWHFYDARAAMEPRIGELREGFALRKVRPTASFAANALYLEIVRLAYNLVTAL